MAAGAAPTLAQLSALAAPIAPGGPPDFYGLLSLPRGPAPPEESAVRRAYRLAALACHPDKHAAGQKGEAERVFVLVSRALSVLLDPAEREAYHRQCAAARRSAPSGSGRAPPARPAGGAAAAARTRRPSATSEPDPRPPPRTAPRDEPDPRPPPRAAGYGSFGAPPPAAAPAPAAAQRRHQPRRAGSWSRRPAPAPAPAEAQPQHRTRRPPPRAASFTQGMWEGTWSAGSAPDGPFPGGGSAPAAAPQSAPQGAARAPPAEGDSPGAGPAAPQYDWPDPSAPGFHYSELAACLRRFEEEMAAARERADPRRRLAECLASDQHEPTRGGSAAAASHLNAHSRAAFHALPRQDRGHAGDAPPALAENARELVSELQRGVICNVPGAGRGQGAQLHCIWLSDDCAWLQWRRCANAAPAPDGVVDVRAMQRVAVAGGEVTAVCDGRALRLRRCAESTLSAQQLAAALRAAAAAG